MKSECSIIIVGKIKDTDDITGKHERPVIHEVDLPSSANDRVVNMSRIYSLRTTISAVDSDNAIKKLSTYENVNKKYTNSSEVLYATDVSIHPNIDNNLPQTNNADHSVVLESGDNVILHVNNNTVVEMKSGENSRGMEDRVSATVKRTVAKLKHTDVLIFAYMRGGSTFLGEILGKHSNAFYVYEPLRQSLQGYRMSKLEYFGVNQICSMTYGECRCVYIMQSKIEQENKQN